MSNEIKSESKVTLKLTPGQLTPAQKEAGKKFWQKLMNEAKESK